MKKGVSGDTFFLLSERKTIVALPFGVDGDADGDGGHVGGREIAGVFGDAVDGDGDVGKG